MCIADPSGLAAPPNAPQPGRTGRLVAEVTMSNSTVLSHCTVVEPLDASRPVAGARSSLHDRYTGNEAANDLLAARPAVNSLGDGLAPALVPKLSISSWYAISGTAMA